MQQVNREQKRRFNVVLCRLNSDEIH